ncbi:MAG: cyanophycinase [Pleurocapsa sp. MO_226.B13]|nr:cyanophycinase [Pleurocapsa sp. MO_226.B13]
MAGGKGLAKIGVITAASSSPYDVPPDERDSCSASNYKANGDYYVKAFKRFGAAEAERIPIDKDHICNKNSSEVVKQVRSMTGFFFGGGDQSRLIKSFLQEDDSDSPVLAAIRQNYEDGAAIFGTSAGTVIQAGGRYVDARGRSSLLPMITGGESYEALRDRDEYLCVQKNGDDLLDKYYCRDRDDLSYYQKGGFGFFNYGLLDTHFAERGRQGRLVRLAWEKYINDAYAPDENTALVVTDVDTPKAEMSVVGERGVNIFDLSNAREDIRDCRRKADSSYEKICGVKYTYLTQGDKYNPLTKTVTIASWKSPLTGLEHHERAESPSHDILSSPKRENPRELLKVAEDLFDSRSTSTYGETYEDDPIFKVTLTKDKSSGSTGYYDTQDKEKFYSFKNLLLDFYVDKAS